ncbi:hypothetical protein [Streptomyces sp. NPDC088719]|uniref:hypothetical protein n=1 Tax=Streptomyces sp. NPDC088719 TaxID=3365872 RepID=UPI003804D395
MASPEEQIQQLKADLGARDSRLTGEIQKKLDKDQFSFLAQEQKKKDAGAAEKNKTFEASLKKLIATEVEAAGASVWKPDSRYFKTPEFMGLVTALTAGAAGAAFASIGLTFVKYDFAIFDLTEKVNRAILRLTNLALRRTQWQNQIRTSQHNAELDLNRRFHDLDKRLTLRIKDAAKKLNKRIDALDRRVAANTRARNTTGHQVRNNVQRSPGTIPATRPAAADLNELHRRVDQLAAAIG